MTLAEHLAAIQAKRSTARLLPGGSAPYVTSEAFKVKPTRGAYTKERDDCFSNEANRHSNSTLKTASTLHKPKETISLGTARPAPQFYPWQSISMTALNINLVESPPIEMPCEKGENAYDLGIALNYGYAAGSPQLLRFVTEHVEMVHSPPYRDWRVSLTCSTTSAVDIVLRMLCDPGISILLEAFTYPGTIETAKKLNLKPIAVRMDDAGLCPDNLRSILQDWKLSDGPRPKLLYSIPTGQNPTGITQTETRRRAIYAVAEQYDLLIIEDDPYYLIQLGHSSNLLEISQCQDASIQLQEDRSFLSGLPPSYLSLDTSGRVLRLETTSKILAPGLRCGWITGCSRLIEKFIAFTELSTVAPSGLSQILLYKLLDEAWGHAGFFRWLEHLSSQHGERLRILVAACEKYLHRGLCSWTVPSAGMFLWIRVDWRQHPTARPDRDHGELVLEIEDRLYSIALEHGVLISKGSWFVADVRQYEDVAFRLTFAAAGDLELDLAIKRLGTVIDEQFGLK